MDKPWHEQTATALGAGIAAGRIDPVELAEHFLARIESLDADRRVYIRPTPARARAEAAAARQRQRDGRRLGPLDGVPLSWKDLFDTAGIATTFGSALFRDRVPATDAAVVTRAARAGMVCLGKTGLSELAYSGLGINPTFGTPANACDAAVERVPGGSSSGAGVSVAAGLAPVGIGTDTGGSVRIPAAWNGLVGLKTTAGRLPLAGTLPLCPSYDTIGPLARDVADCAAMFAVLDDARPADLRGASLQGVRLLLPTTIVFDDLDDTVRGAVEAALEKLAKAGAVLQRAPVPELQEAFDAVARYGNVISSEGYALWHRELESAGGQVFAPIRERLLIARQMTAFQAESAHLVLADIARRFQARTCGWQAVVMPTVPVVAMPIAPLLESRDAFDRANVLSARNTRFGNLMGGCGLTVPCQPPGALPVGLSFLGGPAREGAILRLGAAAERTLAA
jgi:aspartyl-tRNA(Asn)/glutamyl-tRNA(Gln) amidotransferase subunit A